VISNIPSMWFIKHIIKLKYLKILVYVTKLSQKQNKYISLYVQRKLLEEGVKINSEIKYKVSNSPHKNI